MKELLKKVFSENTAINIVAIVSIFLIFTLVIFPGLTAADTVANIFAVIIALFTLVFLYHYITKLLSNTPQEEIKPGETELDYISPVEVKKKRTTKKPKATTNKTK